MSDPTPISDEELDTLEHQANVGIAAGWVGINPHKVLGMVASLRRLHAVEKELREALTFYADEGNYSDGNIHAGSQSILLDNGERARAGLARETAALNFPDFNNTEPFPKSVLSDATAPPAPARESNDMAAIMGKVPAEESDEEFLAQVVAPSARDTPTAPDHFAGAGNMVPARDTLHQQVMNIPCEPRGQHGILLCTVHEAYARGHRDARHAAAELVSAAAAELVQQQQGGWISTRDSAPKEGDDVFVCFRSDRTQSGYERHVAAWFSVRGWVSPSLEIPWNSGIEAIPWWMPLPPLPVAPRET